MTFKHIEFYDSPVMIELARQAIQKGTVKPLSMDEILKNASDTQVDDCQPSGNLMLDVSRLAEGLRAKGYVKEAISLEAKLMEYKRAGHVIDKPPGEVILIGPDLDRADADPLPAHHLPNPQRRGAGVVARLSQQRRLHGPTGHHAGPSPVDLAVLGARMQLRGRRKRAVVLEARRPLVSAVPPVAVVRPFVPVGRPKIVEPCP
jgi:hypothetical protein